MKLSQEDILAKLKTVEFHVFHGRLTICIGTLVNGFFVTGQSCPISAENFSTQVGQELAYKDMLDKVWMLEGYLALERMHNMPQDAPSV